MNCENKLIPQIVKLTLSISSRPGAGPDCLDMVTYYKYIYYYCYYDMDRTRTELSITQTAPELQTYRHIIICN